MPVCVMHWLHHLALHRYKSLWWDTHSPVTSSCNLIQRVDLWLPALHLLTYICLGTVEAKKAVFCNKKKKHILSFPMKSWNISWETWQWSSKKFPCPLFPVRLPWAEIIKTEALTPGVHRCQGRNLRDSCSQSGSPVRERFVFTVHTL